jgi:hypothetical protein
MTPAADQNRERMEEGTVFWGFYDKQTTLIPAYMSACFVGDDGCSCCGGGGGQRTVSHVFFLSLSAGLVDGEFVGMVLVYRCIWRSHGVFKG